MDSFVVAAILVVVFNGNFSTEKKTACVPFTAVAGGLAN